MDLQCFDRNGVPDNVTCTKSQKIREDFRFLFEGIIKQFDLKLKDLSANWDLPAAKYFPIKERLDIKSKDLKSIAVIVASIHMTDKKEGVLLFKKCKDAFASHFGMYESFRMKTFFDDVLKPLVINVWTKINGTVIRSCITESDACIPSLIQAYTELYLPFFTIKFPIMKLGFGQFLSYFSRFATKNSDGEFLKNKKPLRNEKFIEKYLATIFDNLTEEKDPRFNISVFELVKTLQLPKRVYKKVPYANYLMKKFGCGGNERDKLNGQWLDWSDIQVDAEKQTQLESPITSPPCKNISEAERDGVEFCCKATHHLQSQVEPILKVMKYAAQPPHYMEDDQDMASTFQNASFLNYPLVLPVPNNRFYGDGVYNYNAKIPICQFRQPRGSQQKQLQIVFTLNY